MHRELDSLETSTAPKDGERRDPARQLIYVRKLNRILAILTLTLTASLFTSIAVGWQLYQDRDRDLYFDCVNFAAIGVKEPSCEQFEWLIDSNTNAYRRWGQRLKDRSTEQQKRESKEDDPK